MVIFLKEHTFTLFKKLGRTKKVIKVEKISRKYDILTVEKIAFIENKMKRIIEMNLKQIEIEARRLKAKNMQI